MILIVDPAETYIKTPSITTPEVDNRSSRDGNEIVQSVL